MKQEELNASIYFSDYKTGQVLGTAIGTRGIPNRGSLMDFKSREKVIQIGAGISNRSKEIPNRGKID